MHRHSWDWKLFEYSFIEFHILFQAQERIPTCICEAQHEKHGKSLDFAGIGNGRPPQNWIGRKPWMELLVECWFRKIYQQIFSGMPHPILHHYILYSYDHIKLVNIKKDNLIINFLCTVISKVVIKIHFYIT